MTETEGSHNTFARDLYRVHGAKSPAPGNVVFSPASIHGCLMLVFMGAGGRTAEELRATLKLEALGKEDLAKRYKELWNRHRHTNAAGPTMKFVNRLYVNSKWHLKLDFSRIASVHLESSADVIDFADSLTATKKINEWVELETNHRIQELLQPNTLNSDTSAIAINVLYFKAKWAIPFTPETTLRKFFHASETVRFEVEMMHQDDKFLYAEVPELKSKVLKLPYAKSDLSMLIILPDQINGLSTLESALQGMPLHQIDNRMKLEHVRICLPKFRIEYDLDLLPLLRELGIKDIFENSANLSELFVEQSGQKISEVRHRGYLDVNEAGSEAAAATFMKIVPMCLNLDEKSFNANHPFVFYIRSKEVVFFAGRCVTPLTS